MRPEVQPFNARAISMLTIWLDTSEGKAELQQELLVTMNEGPEAMAELVIGLVNMAGWLLVKCGGPENRTREILQEIALKNATPD